MSRHDDDRVLGWLNNVEKATAAAQLDSPHCKRRLSSPSRPDNLKRLRLPTPTMSSSQAHHTPPKRHLTEEDDVEEEGETPRPLGSAVFSKRSRLSSRSPTTTSSSSIQSMTGLIISCIVMPVSIEEVFEESTIAGVLDDSMDRLFRALPDLSNHGIIPVQLKALIESTSRFQYLGLSDHAYYNDGRPEERIMFEFDTIKNILKSARKCDAGQTSEAGWNSLVHISVLRVALDKRDYVDWTDVTRATVYPKELIARLSPEMRVLAKSRMVDFAIYLDVNKSWPLFDRLRASLRADGNVFQASINATAYESLKLCPIAIGIETKKPANSNRNAAEAQLAVWATLQLRRFREVANDKLPPPKMVGLLALGHRWTVYFIAQNEKDQMDEIEMYGPYPIGDTESLYGIYRLLGALRALADWVVTDFKAWWEQALAK